MKNRLFSPQTIKNIANRIRSSRTTAVLAFILIQIIIAATLTGILFRIFNFPGEALFAAGLAVTISVGSTLLGYRSFERTFQLKVLGSIQPPQKLAPIYLKHILTAMDVGSLRDVILRDVLPDLKVRQFAMIRLTEDKQPEPVVMLGINSKDLPTSREIPILISEQPIDVNRPDLCCPQWIRLVIPLYDDKKLLAVWLLGAHDPDESYAPADIKNIESLAGQAVLALVNIKQANNLRALYLATLESHELERQKLAAELHDEILNSLALIGGSMDPFDTPPMVLKVYQGAIRSVREMINDLRPPMLNYGLYSGLAALVEELNSLRLEEMQVLLDIPDTDISYDPQVEMHLYRIVQQACQNAIQHSRANSVHISGILEADAIEIAISDDGVGFPSQQNLDLPALLSNHYFGLAGMYERADLIGAGLTINTRPNQGCRVQVTWRPAQVSQA
jgi:signal transduction histidine kinase